MPSAIIKFILLGAVLLAWPATLVAQQTTASVVQHPIFRVGYILQDPEAATTSGMFLRLTDFLISQREITDAMQAAGVKELFPQPFGSHRLLIEAMDAGQVDLVFCSVIDFVYQRGDYEPLFQMRRSGDPHSSTGERRAWHSGVIFVNNRSALFGMETAAAVAALPQYVMSREMAMVGSSSAAGYVYPYLALDRLTTTIPVINSRSVFWDSSTEVVKAVINGVHDIGACDASAIDEVLSAYDLADEKDKLVKVILRTDPVPRDPVVIHTRWLASSPYVSNPATELGRAIIRGVSGFFQSDPTLPRVDRTSREPYQEVAENLERFMALRK